MSTSMSIAVPGPAEDTAVEARFGIGSELEQRVKAQAKRFHTAYRRTIEEAWELGRELHEAKKQVRHGQWIPWVEERIGLTRRTVQRLMVLYETYPERRHVSLFPSVSQALRALPLGPKSEPTDKSPVESKSAAGAGGRGDGRIVTAAQELSRAAERLDPILREKPAISVVHQEFPALCDALQTILSAMVGCADQVASDTGGETTSAKELISALEAALAKACQVRDSILAQGEPEARM